MPVTPPATSASVASTAASADGARNTATTAASRNGTSRSRSAADPWVGCHAGLLLFCFGGDQTRLGGCSPRRRASTASTAPRPI